jgi:hypothetical protein
MKVRYSYEVRYPFPPGRDSAYDVPTEVEDLPPLARKEAEAVGVEAMFGQFYLWEHAGAKLWYWVTPL